MKRGALAWERQVHLQINLGNLMLVGLLEKDPLARVRRCERMRRGINDSIERLKRLPIPRPNREKLEHELRILAERLEQVVANNT